MNKQEGDVVINFTCPHCKIDVKEDDDVLFIEKNGVGQMIHVECENGSKDNIN